MLKINKQQLDVFKSKSKNKFIKISVLFLRKYTNEFVNNKKYSELEAFILEIIDFSKKHRIEKEINIQRLMLFKINHGFNYKLNSEFRYALSGTSFSESYRMMKFEEALQNKSKRESINLDTQL